MIPSAQSVRRPGAMFGDLPIAIEIATWVSALAAGSIGFIAARNVGRKPWLWAVAAFLAVFPALIVLQTRPSSGASDSFRWWPRFLLAALLIAASVVIDQAPLRSQRIAAIEARAADAWFSDRTLLAEGPILHTGEARLEFAGNFSRPLVLGLAGAALGALTVRRPLLSLLTLGCAGIILGAAAWVVVITTATGRWLAYPTQIPELPGWPSAVAFGVLLWAAIGWAALSGRSRRLTSC